MTEELTYETIPNEFWPKCSWCGRDLGYGEAVFVDLEFEGPHPQGPTRVCGSCREILFHEVKHLVPWVLTQFMNEFGDDKESIKKFMKGSEVQDLWPKEVLAEAIQNMKESRDS